MATDSPTVQRKKDIADVIGGLILLAVGVFFVTENYGFGILRDGGRMAAGAMPVFTGSALALCAVGILAGPAKRLVLARTAGAAPAADVADDSAPASGSEEGARSADSIDSDVDHAESGKMLKAFIVLGLTMAATWLAPRIGFLLAFLLLIFFIWVVLEKVRPIKALVLTAGFGVFVHYVFLEFLRIPVPRSPFLPFL